MTVTCEYKQEILSDCVDCLWRDQAYCVLVTPEPRNICLDPFERHELVLQSQICDIAQARFDALWEA